MLLNLSDVYPHLHTNYCGRRVVYLTSTTSTMDVARREAEEGAPEGTLVIAEEQTAGRGRFNRRWSSPKGVNLYFTVILRPGVRRLRALSIVAPLAVCRGVDSVSSARPLIKWPNDVVVDGKKLAGVLIESELSGSEVRYALVGVGVNVNDRLRDPEVASIATSLILQSDKKIAREKLLANLMNHLEELYLRSAAGHQVRDWWRARLDTLGKSITVRFRDQAYEGIAEDVDDQGNLQLRLNDGNIVTFEAGEVSLRA